MFQFAILLLCLVFTIGYIFFAASGEHEEEPVNEKGVNAGNSDIDVA